MNKNLLAIAIIIAGVLIAGAIVYTNYSKSSEEGEVLSSQEAGEKMVNFISDNILQGEAAISLIETLEENGLYKVKFEVEGEEVEWRITKDGELIFPQVIDLAEFELPAEETGQTIGNFSVSNDEVCKENGKPIVYFFGSEECSYCKWEHPVMEEVAAKFEGEIAFHNNMDSEADMDVFSKYSTGGGIPTLVLGCKYYRVGAGTQSGEEKETEYLTALICKLTENKPADVCSSVQDLINEIKD
ncbi:thioredoxin family protein [Patescibacteria group bacterium]|nr:thioredoxin family protein [Patescibacteria group bacterium]